VGIIEVVVYGSLLANVKTFDSIEEDAFVWNCNICMVSCVFPNACQCVAKCCAYLEVWVLHWKALLCSLN
jgi:pyruvoyl-dependent arginine decarboxylase (PvlArgDC)